MSLALKRILNNQFDLNCTGVEIALIAGAIGGTAHQAKEQRRAQKKQENIAKTQAAESEKMATAEETRSEMALEKRRNRSGAKRSSLLFSPKSEGVSTQMKGTLGE